MYCPGEILVYVYIANNCGTGTEQQVMLSSVI